MILVTTKSFHEEEVNFYLLFIVEEVAARPRPLPVGVLVHIPELVLIRDWVLFLKKRG